MAGIFIHYRREDSFPYAGRLFDRLARDLGSEIVLDFVVLLPSHPSSRK